VNGADRTWAVFTKPWPTLDVTELAALVSRMGFNAIEFPLRPGFQVDLDRLGPSLGRLSTVMADHGVSIASVASGTTPAVFEACAEQNIPIIRIMINIAAEGYLATGDLIRRKLDDLVPMTQKYGVQIGVQPHYDDYIADSSELATLLKDYDPAAIAAIWDAAHDGLARKHPSNALAVLGDRLAMANFKNACYQHSAPTEDGAPPWQVTFVEGPDGLCSWPEAAEYLVDHDYSGPICLPAEYTDETDLETKVSNDLGYLRGLMDGRG
jgi:sugar phosphate isomerase/epimerase